MTHLGEPLTTNQEGLDYPMTVDSHLREAEVSVHAA
jgi:hypothetical protein